MNPRNKKSKSTKLTVIISVFNEADNLPLLHQHLTKVFTRLKSIKPLFVFVDDGSTDQSNHILKKLAQKDRRVKSITLTRNFGHEAAMLAGIDTTKADAYICMDADLQHPPELLPQMIRAYQQGHPIVLMKRQQSILNLRDLFSQSFYWAYNLANHQKLEPGVTDFFLISANIAAILRHQYRENRRFLRAILQSLGFQPIIISFQPHPRIHSISKYGFSELIVLSFQDLLAYSPFALNLCLIASASLSLLSISLIIFSIIMWAIGNTIPGYTTVVVFMSGMAAMQFLILGIIAHYLGILIHEVKHRPIYIVKTTSRGLTPPKP